MHPSNAAGHPSKTVSKLPQGRRRTQTQKPPDSRITQMKDGRTHLAYKAEHVVDLKSDLVLAAEVLPADHGDTQTMVDSVVQAQVNLAEAGSEQ
jgi:hypothetical protein